MNPTLICCSDAQDFKYLRLVAYTLRKNGAFFNDRKSLFLNLFCVNLNKNVNLKYVIFNKLTHKMFKFKLK